MATLVLGLTGQAIGGPILGAIGAIGGRFIDQALFGQPKVRREQEGPRLKSVDLTASTEGAPITRLYGRSRLAGQIIWATRLEEEVIRRSETTRSGGKGGSGGSVTTTTTEYRYYANFAVGLAEGAVARIGRIWADGRELDQSTAAGKGTGTVRKYPGSEDQPVDSLIAAKEGADNAPAYRGLAYIVFERLLLEDYGNRIPQITAEVFRPVGRLEGLVEGVAVIPGTTELGYEPQAVRKIAGPGQAQAENRHTMVAASDWQASMELLADLAPNCGAVALVVAWFGSDLRCGACEIKPKVDNADKETSPISWAAAGLTRVSAEVVSQVGGRPAYGGSPNDASVVRAIQDLKSRGLKVLLYPFIMMDIPAGNTLPSPYSDNAGETGQPAHPWRGRITCSPAPGFAGSPDKTGAAADQVATFVERSWGYRNFILHMADLCAQAGGVDAFCIGSEMVGMTRVRDGAASYPFVAALRSLAGEARVILGAGTKISYAADWSEYHSHRPDDGSGDVLFNLDPLWSDAAIDFIGIDNYLPLSDWRDGSSHLDYDAVNGPTSIYDQDYLKANIEGGEYYDWHYPAAGATGNEPSQARIDQQRAAIADAAHGEPWVFGNKRIREWWQNAHHDRPDGVRSSTPTAWVPQSKPIWLTELGVPAVDKGANQPNVFHDPKSSESFFPYFSSGARDDAMQRAALEAWLTYWAEAANNPVSAVYGQPMIDTARTFVWAWDARMAPSFPEDARLWADAENWDRGHWISGRLGAAPATETVEQIFADYGFGDGEVAAIGSVADALIADRVLSARQLVEAAAFVHQFDAVESEGKIKVRDRRAAAVAATIGLDDLVHPSTGSGDETGDRYTETRAQETELPGVVKLVYGEPTSDDQTGAVEARRLAGRSLRTLEHHLPAVMHEGKARAIAEAALHDAWIGRERLELALPPSFLRLDPGDVVHFAPTAETFRLTEIGDAAARRLRAIRSEAGLFGDSTSLGRRSRAGSAPSALATPVAVFMDGPLLADHHAGHTGYVAAFMAPWPGGVAFHRSASDTGFILDQVASKPAILGETAFDFFSGPVWRWDRGNELWVDLHAGELASGDEIAILGGANALAIENPDGEWEVLQFRDAELMAPRRYKLTSLLRGQRGSEHAMRDPVPAGARVLLLDDALRQTGLGSADVGLPFTWKIGPASRDIGDESYDTREVTFEGKGRQPLSPVHIGARRDATTSDLTIHWIRRTRIGGDSWESTEVPLGEDDERYALEILDPNDDSLVRSVTGLTVPSYLYEAAEQVADFGSTVTTVRVRVFQLSDAFGRGMPALAWANG